MAHQTPEEEKQVRHFSPIVLLYIVVAANEAFEAGCCHWT